MRVSSFVLRLPLQPKARPRFGSGRAYKDQRYREWMLQCRAVLSEWWLIPPLDKQQLVTVHFTFNGPGTSDLDNLVGAVMDAGKGILWTDDRVTVVKRISADWQQQPKYNQSIVLRIVWNDKCRIKP